LLELNILDNIWILLLRDQKRLINWIARKGQYMVLRNCLIFNNFVQVINLLEIILKLSSFTRGDVLLYLDSFEITKLRVDRLNVALVLDELDDLLLLRLVLVVRIHQLNVVPLIDKEILLA
jgi:hypothetical protein